MVRRLNANAHEWWKIAEHHQSWDVAQQDLVTTVGIREGCEDSLSRVDGGDAVDSMNIWFDNAIANALQLNPLRLSTCRQVGEEEVVLSAASLSRGFLNLVVDWGDENTHRKGLNVKSGAPYAFTHAYERAGNYQVTATAFVRRLKLDRTAWEVIESKMTTTINVRNECTFINRAGIDVMGDWYNNILDSTILFKPLNLESCRSVGQEATTLTVASASSGYMVLSVDWGTGQTMHYGVNVATGAPVGFPFVYYKPGAYTIKAVAKVRRLSVGNDEWEVLQQAFETTVEISQKCSPPTIDLGDEKIGIQEDGLQPAIQDDADFDSNEGVSSGAFTVIDYYYTVETTPDGTPDTFGAEVESGILAGITDDVALPGIGAITSRPADSQLTECKWFFVCMYVFILCQQDCMFMVIFNSLLRMLLPYNQAESRFIICIGPYTIF